MPKKHIVDRNLATVASLGVVNDGLGLDYFIPDKDKIKQKDIPAAHMLGYIALVIGAALATKKMPLHKLAELCAAVNHPIILLGDKGDFEADFILRVESVRATINHRTIGVYLNWAIQSCWGKPLSQLLLLLHSCLLEKRQGDTN